MDPRRFDSLVKSLSRSSTRRSIARLLTGLPLGVLLASRFDEAPDATAKDDDHGSSHRRHQRKAKHRHQTGNDKEHRKGKRKGCNPQSRAKTCTGKCATVRNNCGDEVDCGPCTCATGCPQCQTCNSASGLCDPVANGGACNDGNACTQTDTCQNGVCVGTNPVVCTALDQCHKVGTCNPSTGVCSNPIQDNGTGCDDGNACTQTDTCQNGTCVGANPLADGQCCGTPLAGTRCEGGACVTATATLSECQGRCGGGSVTICGQAANCPDCIRCGCGLGFCGDAAGPLGQGSYCAEQYTGDLCPGGSCPTPNTICCSGTCETICTTERDV